MTGLPIKTSVSTRQWRILGRLALALVATMGAALADAEDRLATPERQVHDGWARARPDVAAVTNALYGEECGACHMAYQPGLLPASAWARVMDPAALADHYGDDAALPESTSAKIRAYLSANAADQAHRPRARAFAVTDPNRPGPVDSAPRITETWYFTRKHHEIPAKMVASNPDVGHFSQCQRCHQKAAEGIYHEDQVDIPGFGLWDD